MRVSDVDILIVPGWTGSGPDHWQSRWEQRLKTARRIVQDDWDQPVLATWMTRIADEVAKATRPVVLVAHSCGVATVVHTSHHLPRDRVIGAYLVAPASEAATREIPGIDSAFTPFPRDPLPFPSVLVASRDDALCSYDDAGDLALSWGSTLVDAGTVGHLNTASGHGPWPEGAMRFGLFLKHLGEARVGK